MKKFFTVLIAILLSLTSCQSPSASDSMEFRPSILQIMKLLPGLYKTDTAIPYTSYCTWSNTDKTSILVDNNVQNLCLWIIMSDSKNTITQILVHYDHWSPTLLELVSRYGTPDEVKWSGWAFYRYVVWSSQGVMALVPYEQNVSSADTSFILYFEPMPTEDFSKQYQNWPWSFAPTFTSENNIYEKGYRGVWDNLPQDPFDWKSLTPTPSNN